MMERVRSLLNWQRSCHRPMVVAANAAGRENPKENPRERPKENVNPRERPKEKLRENAAEENAKIICIQHHR